jgi:hypothetical protein
LPSGIVSGSCGLSSVHGQPVRPGGGGGSSLSVGQRMGHKKALARGERSNIERNYRQAK